ncbi:MAG: Gfo/Idh/MocA family oxidoreductase [Treponema sp.]|jgi:predicted dehydrogenase|nr:Gfo/Idh/MocA family oxidoreductase [Treponema sp.]
MEKLRLGVLGCSGHCARMIAPPLRHSRLIELYAVASRDEAKARQYAAQHGFPKSYGSYEALLEDAMVDFVYIPLPNHLHLEYIQKSADAGKPVICEKPICLNADETVQAAQYCRQRNIPLMEAFMYRFHPQWVKAKEIVSSGEIGEVLAVHGHFSYSNKDENNIRNKTDCGGGALYDIGCYAVSGARFLFGREPERVLCSLVRDSSFKTDIFTSGILDFGGGGTATFTASTQMFSFQQVSAVGSGGSLIVELPFSMSADVPARFTVNGSTGQRLIETKPADQYLLEFEAFADAFIHKTEVPTPVTDAIANIAVLDALFRSAESGTWEPVKHA